MTIDEIVKHLNSFALVVDSGGEWNIYRLIAVGYADRYAAGRPDVVYLAGRGLVHRRDPPRCLNRRPGHRNEEWACLPDYIRKIVPDKVSARELIEQLNEMEQEVILARDRFRVAIELL